MNQSRESKEEMHSKDRYLNQIGSISSSKQSPNGNSKTSSIFSGSVNNDSENSRSYVTEKNIGLTDGSSPLTNS